MLYGWGRGLAAETAMRIIQQQRRSSGASLLGITELELNVVADRLELLRSRKTSEPAINSQAITALLAAISQGTTCRRDDRSSAKR